MESKGMTKDWYSQFGFSSPPDRLVNGWSIWRVGWGWGSGAVAIEQSSSRRVSNFLSVDDAARWCATEAK
jgi:hypothetical protein